MSRAVPTVLMDSVLPLGLQAHHQAIAYTLFGADSGVWIPPCPSFEWYLYSAKIRRIYEGRRQTLQLISSSQEGVLSITYINKN